MGCVPWSFAGMIDHTAIVGLSQEGTQFMLLSVVIPLFNEEETLPLLLKRLWDALEHLEDGISKEILFINDGSSDATARILEEAGLKDARIKAIHFSRNFGHQAAVTAGLDIASGDAVVVMDADLQDPPELLAQMIEKYREGYDIVSPQRVSRDGETWFKKITAQAFYSLMRAGVDKRLTSQVGDFRLYSRAAVLGMRGLRERHRFLRGMVAWLGLKEAVIPFKRSARVAGETKYPLWKMLRFAWTAITSSSALPLRITSFAGLLSMLGGFVYLGYILYVTFVTQTTVPGWSSLASLQVLFNGAILLAIGLVGDYLARVYEEAKDRPLYVVDKTLNVTVLPKVDGALWLPERVIRNEMTRAA